MYSRPIGSVVQQKLLEKDERQQLAAAEYFRQGLHYAKFPHRDDAKCANAFANAIESITTHTPQARWLRSDYLLIMQSFQQLVINAVCSRTAGSQQRAAALREQAMSFFNNQTDLDCVSFSYFITAFLANLDCALGIYEDTVLFSKKMTEHEMQAIACIAADMIKIMEQLVNLPYHSAFTVQQLRELADCYRSLGHVYYIVADHKNLLKYYSMSIKALMSIQYNENIEQDFKDISIIYGRLAIIFNFDKNYQTLFECARDYFSGDSLSYDALKNAIVQNSMVVNDTDARNAIILQLMTLIGKHRKHPYLPQNEKHVKFLDQTKHADFKSMLRAQQASEASHRNRLTRSSIFRAGDGQTQEPSTAAKPRHSTI